MADLTTTLVEQPVRGHCLAVIPARGGSRGVPRKAAREVGGLSLLARGIHTARAAHSIHRTVVSTDDAELAALARAAGAQVPFLRPAELATDSSPVIAAVFDLLDRLDGPAPDFICLLQPTSPFTRPSDVDGAFARLGEHTDAVVSVCRSEVRPDWLRQVGANGFLAPAMPLAAAQHTPRQQLPEVWRLNGAIYWIRRAALRREGTFLPPRTRHFEMPVERSLDIDSPHDLRLARWLEENSHAPLPHPDHR